MPMRNEPDTLEGPCDHCGQRYVPWVTSDGVWNRVVGGDANAEAPGRLCPTCFCLKADVRLGTTTTIWRLEPRP